MTTISRPWYGGYLVNHPDGCTDYVQSDWEFPRLAQDMGWSLRQVQSSRRRPCLHLSTDGTVDCPDCGVSASEFIAAASEFLDMLSAGRKPMAKAMLRRAGSEPIGGVA
jgi:hypothetical protein